MLPTGTAVIFSVGTNTEVARLNATTRPSPLWISPQAECPPESSTSHDYLYADDPRHASTTYNSIIGSPWPARKPGTTYDASHSCSTSELRHAGSHRSEHLQRRPHVNGGTLLVTIHPFPASPPRGTPGKVSTADARWTERRAVTANIPGARARNGAGIFTVGDLTLKAPLKMT